MQNTSREVQMNKRYRRLSHSVYECKYHVVFCPKYRYRILKDDIAEYTRQQIYQLCRQKDKVGVLEMNVQPDHVHLIVSIPRQIPPPLVVVFDSSTWTIVNSQSVYTLVYHLANPWSSVFVAVRLTLCFFAFLWP